MTDARCVTLHTRCGWVLWSLQRETLDCAATFFFFKWAKRGFCAFFFCRKNRRNLDRTGRFLAWVNESFLLLSCSTRVNRRARQLIATLWKIAARPNIAAFPRCLAFAPAVVTSWRDWLKNIWWFAWTVQAEEAGTVGGFSICSDDPQNPGSVALFYCERNRTSRVHVNWAACLRAEPRPPLKHSNISTKRWPSGHQTLGH